MDSFSTRARRDFRGETYLGYWLGLPWRCKFACDYVLQESWNENVPGIPEEVWYECSRCDGFGGYAL